MGQTAEKKVTDYRREDLLSVVQICHEIPGLNGGPCSRSHVYSLIDQGKLSPTFRYGQQRGMFVPREAVERYKNSCLYDPDE